MLKELVLKAIMDLVQMFKPQIQKDISKSKVLVEVIKWLKILASDTAAFVSGTPLPKLDSGNAIIDSIAPMILDLVESEIKVPADFAAVIESIDGAIMPILEEVDPQAAATLAAPPVDPKAPAKEKAAAAISKVNNSLTILQTISNGDLKKASCKSAVDYHIAEISDAVKTLDSLSKAW